MKYPNASRPMTGPAFQEPLADRVDRDGMAQHADPAAARRARARGRVSAKIADGLEPDQSDVDMAAEPESD